MLKKILTVVLVMVMLISVCACTPSQEPTLTPTPTQEETPTPSPEPTPKEDLTIGDFVIIFPEMGDISGFALRNSAINLSVDILATTGVKCSMSEDIIDEESGYFENTYEILLGNTNRKESLAVNTEDMRYYDYLIRYEGTKIVINGGSDEAITNAVDYFISDILKSDFATVEGFRSVTNLDTVYVYESNINRMYINGEYINSFKVITELDDGTAEEIISSILEHAGEKVTKGKVNKETDFEIIIGDCDRAEYKEVIANMKDRDYAVEVVNGKLVIAGKTDRGVELALEKFKNDYLRMQCDKLDINSETDFEYKHAYPISSLKLCSKDISEYVIVTSLNNVGIAKKLSKKLEEMTGEKIKIVTDSANLYEAAIVLSKSGDEKAKALLKNLDDDTVQILSDGTKIYIGTNNIKYGDSPAINAFITDILGYDMVLGKAKNSTVEITSINYKTNIADNAEKFEITQYHGIRQKYILNEDGTLNTYRIDENVEAGMNVIDLNFNTQTNKMALEYCSKIGIRCTVYDYRISNLVYAETLPENWVDILQDVVDDYSQYTAMYYYGICDEPATDKFERLRLICMVLEELDPARRQYINHYPTGEDWYEEFMQVVHTDMLSYDRYVFEETNDYLGDFFANLKAARKVGLKYDAEYMAIHLLMEHGKYEGGPNYRYLNEAELSWQAYVSLAYGVSSVSYFTYWAPSFDSNSLWYNNDAMINENGEKTAHYYEIQNIMKRFSIIADALVDRLSLGVFHTKEYVSNHDVYTTLFTGYDTIKDVVADDVTVGMFEDDMMLIANGSYTESMDVEIVTDSKLLILDTQTGNWNELKDNKFTLEAGSGDLIKIIK